MKKITLLTLILLLSALVYGQTIIENPGTGFSTASNVKIKSIEIRDTATILSFHTTYTPFNQISIPKKTFIQPLNGSEKLYIVSTEGIPLGGNYTMPASGEVDYRLVFPKIDPSVSKLDYGEDNDGGTWFIYDILLKAVPEYSLVPKELRGNWFNKANGNWELSFFDSAAVYKKKVWDYGEVKLKNGKGTIELKGSKNNIRLAVKSGSDGSCSVGESTGTLKEYVSDLSGRSTVRENDEAFKTPVFKYDSTTLSGYVRGYNPRMGRKTAIIYVNDIITGQQNSFMVKLSDTGVFSVKLPIYYPHSVFTSSDIFGRSIFLEPGKDLFLLIDSNRNKKLFMGESGRINSDLNRLEKINSFNYSEMQNKILNMTSVQFKSYCMDSKKKDMDALEAIMGEHSISSKAYQVKKLELEYRYASYMMDYNGLFQNTYRTKNKIPQTQRTLPIQLVKLTAGYFDFITNEMVNNPLAVLSTDYGHFINQFKFSEILRGKPQGLSPMDIIIALETSGYTLTDEEKELAIGLKELEAPGIKKAEREFSERYAPRAIEFSKKYNDKLVNLRKEKKGETITYAVIEKYLIDNGVIFSDEEKVLIEEMKEYDNSEASIKRKEFQKKYMDSMQKFYNDHQSFTSSFMSRQTRSVRNEKMEKELGVKIGFASDIMDAQDESRPIAAEMTPVSDEALQAIQKQIKTPFIAEYIAICNNAAKAKLKANKTKTGYIVNQAPRTEADQLFEGIMKKYVGKVVLVDFWATWCAPCRSGIERIKPLKEEMSGQDCVFVYITGPSSPKQTYDNMIPDIKGEHYRVTLDEWNYLCGKFNISGIPHQLLVDKKGAVINPHLGYMTNESLKKELEKRMKE